MCKWIKCSEKLPQDEFRCWIVVKESEVVDGVFEKSVIRHEWNDSKLNYITTQEPGFRLDDEYCFYAYLDTASYWMPYFTPDPPSDI